MNLPPGVARAMVMLMERLRDQVSTMTATEKIELIEAVWESLEADFPPFVSGTGTGTRYSVGPLYPESGKRESMGSCIVKA
jgi:hypothetical protein